MFNKTIGILGGMGPRATSFFYNCLLNLVGPKEHDREYPRVVISSNPQMPSRTRHILYGEADPTPFMLREIDGLKAQGADFFVCPCNSAHYFLLRAALPVHFLSVTDAVRAECQRLGVQKLTILSGEVPRLTKLFENALPSIEIDYGTEQLQILTRSTIDKIKQGQFARDILDELALRICSSGNPVLLGCTELSLLPDLVQGNFSSYVFDTSVLLASAALTYASF
jgi:aspartate racemase